MPPIHILVRLPGAQDAETVCIKSELMVQTAISMITKQLGAGKLSNAHLIISPTEKKNGSIIPSNTRLSELHFNPTQVSNIKISKGKK